MESSQSAVAASPPRAGPRCPVCGDEEKRHVFDVDSNVDGPLPRSYEVWRCLGCGAGLTHPVPPAESLPLLYGTTAYEQSGGEGLRPAEAYVMAIEDLRLREIHRHRRAPGRMLDVGCGKGRFLLRAAGYGWTVHGLDQAPGQVAAANARYGLEVEHGDLLQCRLPEETFDVITATAIRPGTDRRAWLGLSLPPASYSRPCRAAA